MKLNVTSVPIAFSILLLRPGQAAPLVKQDTIIHPSDLGIHTTTSLYLARDEKRLVAGDSGRLLDLGHGSKVPQLKAARHPISDLPDPSVVIARRDLLGGGSASTSDLKLMAHVEDGSNLQRRQSFWGMVPTTPEPGHF